MFETCGEVAPSFSNVCIVAVVTGDGVNYDLERRDMMSFGRERYCLMVLEMQMEIQMLYPVRIIMSERFRGSLDVGDADGGVWSPRGDAPDHFLRSGLLRLLSSQSPRLARGSLR